MSVYFGVCVTFVCVELEIGHSLTDVTRCVCMRVRMFCLVLFGLVFLCKAPRAPT